MASADRWHGINDRWPDVTSIMGEHPIQNAFSHGRDPTVICICRNKFHITMMI